MALPSQRIWTDDVPLVMLAELFALVVVHRGGGARAAIHELLDVAAGGGRRVEEQHAAGLAAGVFPRMRDVAWKEGAGAGTADAHVVADLEGDLALEHPGDPVAVAMQGEGTLGAAG